MEVGIGGIFELQRGKRARGFRGHGAAAADGARHGLCLRSADHGGAKATHEDAFLFRKAFGHKEHDLVAAMHAHQGKPHPGIAGGRLEDGCARLQQTTPFGVQNHAQRGPVLDAAAGIEELEFGVNIGRPGGHHPVKVQHGGGPHQLRHIFGDMQRARCNLTSKKGHRPTDKCSSREFNWMPPGDPLLRRRAAPS